MRHDDTLLETEQLAEFRNMRDSWLEFALQALSISSVSTYKESEAT